MQHIILQGYFAENDQDRKVKSHPFISEETMAALQEGLEEKLEEKLLKLVSKQEDTEEVKKGVTKLEKKLLKLSAGTFCEHCQPKILGLLDESDSVIQDVNCKLVLVESKEKNPLLSSRNTTCL